MYIPVCTRVRTIHTGMYEYDVHRSLYIVLYVPMYRYTCTCTCISYDVELLQVCTIMVRCTYVQVLCMYIYVRVRCTRCTRLAAQDYCWSHTEMQHTEYMNTSWYTHIYVDYTKYRPVPGRATEYS